MATKKIIFVNDELTSGSSADQLRIQYGVWKSTTSGLIYDKSALESREVTKPEIISKEILPINNDGISLQGTRYTIRIEQRTFSPNFTRRQGTNGEWEGLVKRLVKKGFTFKDYASFAFTRPIIEESLNSGVDLDDDGHGVRYVYNYFDEPYEMELDTVTDHTIIPNMYTLIKRAYESDNEETLLKAPTKRTLIRNKRVKTSRQVYKNQIVPIENNNMLANYSGNKHLFPMYAQINLIADQNSEFSNILKDTGLSAMLIRDMEESLGLGTFGEKTIIYSTSIYDSSGNKRINNFSSTVKFIDLAEWRAYDAPSLEQLDSESIFVGPWTLTEEVSTFDSAFLLSTGLSHFYDRINSLALEKSRTFIEILDGAPAYSETLMYTVTKHLGADPTKSAPVQTFYMMNYGDVRSLLGESRKIRFIDTQVKYAETYSYVVTAYQAVVGATYKYDNIFISADANPRSAEIDVEVQPTIQLIQIPLFMSTGKIVDHPPLPPQVDFKPIRGQPEKIIIFLDSSTGEKDAVPITINAAEEKDINQVMINQGRTDGLVTYRTDDAAREFQIYRTQMPPTSYEDYRGALLAQVPTISQDSKINLRASSAPVIVSQRTNRKYYYMFRVLDTHGHASNPSPIYEVELYEDSGVGYPIIREYVLKNENPTVNTKSARKIIQIVPRITQAFLDEKGSGLVTSEGALSSAAGNMNILLGVEEDKLFGKRFKVRIASRSTGKKIDINIDFKTKRVRGETE
jgi:hypothetical protein